jgi:hypothetical protein
MLTKAWLMVVAIGILTTMITQVHATTGSEDSGDTEHSNTTPSDENGNTLPTGDACYDAGLDDGKNSNFNREAFGDACGPLDSSNDYYKGFIDGCMEADNPRDVCESAADK